MMSSSSRIKDEIAALEDLPRPELVQRWQSHYRTEPPRGITRKLLVRAITYEMQAKRCGGLRPASSRRLLKIAQGVDVAKASQPTALKSGTRLIREWNGITHTVEVIEGGFIWNGTSYPSLSAVARAITGARWSGPRFFGTKP
jgi:hypothetical protein